MKEAAQSPWLLSKQSFSRYQLELAAASRIIKMGLLYVKVTFLFPWGTKLISTMTRRQCLMNALQKSESVTSCFILSDTGVWAFTEGCFLCVSGVEETNIWKFNEVSIFLLLERLIFPTGNLLTVDIFKRLAVWLKFNVVRYAIPFKSNARAYNIQASRFLSGFSRNCKTLIAHCSLTRRGVMWGRNWGNDCTNKTDGLELRDCWSWRCGR